MIKLSTVLVMSLSGSVLAGAVFLVRRLWGQKLSKRALCLLWLPVLLRLLLPWGFATDFATHTDGEGYPPVTYEDGKADPAQAPPFVPAPPAQPRNNYYSGYWKPAVRTEEPEPAEPEPDYAAAGWTWAERIWLAGAALSLGWYAVSYIVYRLRLRKDLVFLTEYRQTRAFTSALVSTPVLLGLFRPIIVLPRREYEGRELDWALAHEAMHRKRRDLPYKWLAVLARSVHWFNPVAYIIMDRLGRDCELACDEDVIASLSSKERMSYGDTLLALSAHGALPRSVTATTLSESGEELRGRLLAIRDYKAPGSLAALAALGLTCALSLTALAYWAPAEYIPNPMPVPTVCTSQVIEKRYMQAQTVLIKSGAWEVEGLSSVLRPETWTEVRSGGTGELMLKGLLGDDESELHIYSDGCARASCGYHLFDRSPVWYRIPDFDPEALLSYIHAYGARLDDVYRNSFLGEAYMRPFERGRYELGSCAIVLREDGTAAVSAPGYEAECEYYVNQVSAITSIAIMTGDDYIGAVVEADGAITVTYTKNCPVEKGTYTFAGK